MCRVPHQVTIKFANLYRYLEKFYHLVMLSDEHALGAMLGAYVRILFGVRYCGTVGKSSYL